METIVTFINRNKIRATSDWADTNPNMENAENMNHFKVTLRYGRKRMTVLFSQGFGISGEPDAKSVLDCLASDASTVENAQDFEDWASELGYDADSRKAEKTFRACQREAAKLQAFLGEPLYSALLWETERS